MISSAPYGFRIVGDCKGERRLTDWSTAYAAYAACDPRAQVDGEAYHSAFTFGEGFRRHLDSTGTTKGYSGECWAPWLWFDIDRDGDLDAATADARRLCGVIADRYQLDGDEMQNFFSGSKGYHVGLPTALWQPAPSDDFHKCARRFAEQLAVGAKVSIDGGVYDRVRAFRAPNSRHPKTGLHKRRLEFGELLHVTVAAIVERAAHPEPFDAPKPPPLCEAAADDWRQAADAVHEQAAAQCRRRATVGGATLNRATLEFIRDGAAAGDRHRLLYSAAANLGEFGCPSSLAHGLLTEAGLDSGLPPSEVRRQIDCGLAADGAGSDVA